MKMVVISMITKNFLTIIYEKYRGSLKDITTKSNECISTKAFVRHPDANCTSPTFGHNQNSIIIGLLSVF